MTAKSNTLTHPPSVRQLKSQVDALQSTVSSQASEISSLTSRVSSLEATVRTSQDAAKVTSAPQQPQSAGDGEGA